MASGSRSGSCRTTTSTRCPTGTWRLERSVPMRRPTRTARSGRPMPTTRCTRRPGARWSSKPASGTTGIPDLNHVDVSTVGYWGEGWGPYLPSWSVQQQLIDVYFTAFPRTLAADEFRCAARAAVRREARRRMAPGLLGRHGRAGPQLRAHEGFLPATARARRPPGRVADGSGRARDLLGARAVAPVEVPAQADSRSGASLARLDDQHQVQPHSCRVEDGLRRVSEADRISLRAQAARVPVARRPVERWRPSACGGSTPASRRSIAATRSRSRSATPSCRSTPTSRQWLPGTRWSTAASRCRASSRPAATRFAWRLLDPGHPAAGHPPRDCRPAGRRLVSGWRNRDRVTCSALAIDGRLIAPADDQATTSRGGRYLYLILNWLRGQGRSQDSQSSCATCAATGTMPACSSPTCRRAGS